MLIGLAQTYLTLWRDGEKLSVNLHNYIHWTLVPSYVMTFI